jgi:tRNA pseudouridine13 synthase
MVKIRTKPEDFQVEEQAPPTGLVIKDDTELPFAVYELKKIMWETQSLLSVISKKSGIPVAAWGLAGLKDKRSVTTQLVTCPRDHAPRHALRGRGWELIPVGGAHRSLISGDHEGNRFMITVRDIRHRNVQLLPGRIGQLTKIGLPNWFDTQRFGSASQGLLPGQMIASGDLEGAMRLHLTGPQPSDRSARRRDKKRLMAVWPNLNELELSSIENRPFKKVLRAWIEGSKSHDESLRSAFLAVPRSLRGLWMSAWQSKVWNELLRDIIRQSFPDHLLRRIDIGVGGPLLYPRAPVGRRGASKRSLIENIAKTFSAIPDSLEMPTLEGNPSDAVHPSVQHRIYSMPPKGSQLVRSLGIKMSSHTRKTIVFPTNLEVSEPMIDELHGSKKHKRWKCNVSFELPSGSYATNLIRRLFD